MELIGEWMPQLLVAAGQTLQMAGLAYILGAVVGLLLTLGLRSRYGIVARGCRIYIELIRSTPTLTQLFLIYFGLASVGLVIPSFEAAVLALGLHYAAYMAEIYRSGIAAVDQGQTEAAQAIGMTRLETMRYVVLPQSVSIILPPMTNSAISMLKDTSVASLISAPELMLRANDLASEYYMPMQLYLITGVMYFIMAYPLSLGVRYLEHVAAYGRRKAG
ncbi:amino acid ABC transporter permease (plasmid) [Agrobacterium vitis]|nr:amino acid ABC transporter permease [Agrobacterium vitis]QZO07682.1 amino acid ABC transporter permease [Agrobacterium vitis]UJL91021.1 amino acid ABC transporter permease [Agrobacterium vitis]